MRKQLFARLNVLRQAQRFREVMRTITPQVSRGTVYPDVSQSMSKDMAYYFLYELRPNQPMNCMIYQVTAFDPEGVILFHYCNSHANSLWYWYRQGIARTTAAIERSVRHAFSMYGVYLDKDKPFDRVEDHVYQIFPDWYRINYLNKLIAKS